MVLYNFIYIFLPEKSALICTYRLAEGLINQAGESSSRVLPFFVTEKMLHINNL